VAARDLDDYIDLKLPPIRKRERPFEYQLRDELKRRRVMFVKTKPTIEGFPDRLAVGHGCTMLVEAKREDGRLSPTQVLVHRDIRRHGGFVHVAEGPSVKVAADKIVELLKRRSRRAP